MRRCFLAGLLIFSGNLARGQQIAITFDDLPVHTLRDAMSDPAYQDDPDIGEPSGGTFLELMMQKKTLKFPDNTKPYKELQAMCR
jgi:hypothetical protein